MIKWCNTGQKRTWKKYPLKGVKLDMWYIMSLPGRFHRNYR